MSKRTCPYCSYEYGKHNEGCLVAENQSLKAHLTASYENADAKSIKQLEQIEYLRAELKEEQGAAEDLLALLRKTEGELDRLRALLADVRVNSKHPRHEQWRQECDEALAQAENPIADAWAGYNRER